MNESGGRQRVARAIRIIHLIDHINAGGAQTLLLGLAQEQRARGHDVQFVVLHGPGILSGDFVRAGFKPHYLVASKTDPRMVTKLVSFVRARGRCVVHAHLVASCALAEWTRPFFRRGTRVVCHLHNLFAAHGEDKYQDYLEHLLYRRCDLAVACSRAVAKTLRARPGGCRVKLAVAHNAIAESRYQRRDVIARAQIRAVNGLNESDRLLLFVGRLVVQKNIGYGLEILREIRRSGTPARLWIAGDGPCRIALEKMAQKLGVADACSFLGHRGDADLLMSAADLLLLPSYEDACPMVVAEAAARELPTVGAAFASAPELIRDGVTGAIFPLGEPKGAAARIAAILADDEGRAAMGAAAFNFAKDRFTLAALTTRLDRLYASLR